MNFLRDIEAEIDGVEFINPNQIAELRDARRRRLAKESRERRAAQKRADKLASGNYRTNSSGKVVRVTKTYIKNRDKLRTGDFIQVPGKSRVVRNTLENRVKHYPRTNLQFGLVIGTRNADAAKALIRRVLVKKDIKLNREQADDLIHVLRDGTRREVTLTFIDTDGILSEKTFLLNELSINNISRLLETGANLESVETFGSDSVTNLNIESVRDIRFRDIPNPTRVLQKDGRFFDSLNTLSVIDLQRYQIYTQQQAYDLKKYVGDDADDNDPTFEHCLMRCLRLCGISEDKIDLVKTNFLSNNKKISIQKTHLKDISNLIETNIILSYIDSSDKTNKYNANKKVKYDDTIEIALYMNHYFVQEKTNINKFAINSLIKGKITEAEYSEESLNDIVKIVKDGYKRDDTKGLLSLSLIHTMNKAGLFVRGDMTPFLKTVGDVEHIVLTNVENEQADLEMIIDEETGEEKRRRMDITKRDYNTWAADFESFVCGEGYDIDNSTAHSKDGTKHSLYLIGVTPIDINSAIPSNEREVNNALDKVTIYNVCDYAYYNNPVKCAVNKMMDGVCRSARAPGTLDEEDPGTVNIIYFHNLKYDFNVVKEYLNVTDICAKGSALYRVKVAYYYENELYIIELRCSQKLINTALAKFPSMFGLYEGLSKQGGIDYTYFTPENNGKIVPASVYARGLSNKDYHLFMDEQSGNKHFSPTRYYIKYLRYDVLVLACGLKAMNKVLVQAFPIENLCVMTKLTISSLTNLISSINDCFKDTFSVIHNAKNFVSRSVVGGRVHVNEKYALKKIVGDVSDLDAVSMYPSSIKRICETFGFPTGKCKVIPQDQLENWRQYKWAFLEIRITKVNKHQQIPMISYKTEDGGVLWTNDIRDETIVANNIDLDSWIRFQQIEFEIIAGVYYDGEGNTNLGQMINTLHSIRLEAKKQGNVGLSTLVKLMMNSIYGKTAQKSTFRDTRIQTVKKNVKNSEGEWETIDNPKFDKFKCNNFNTITSISKINSKQVSVEMLARDDFNLCHIASLILSTARHMMNEVFDIAQDLDLPIYYTDTDSMHLNREDIPKIASEYKIRYGRSLEGKGLGQFHPDFEIEGCEDVFARKSIFLGKKSYIDQIQGTNSKTGEIEFDYHVRLKGVTKAGIKHAVTEGNYIDEFDMFEDMMNGTAIKFVLNPYLKDEGRQAVKFNFNDEGVFTSGEFIREVKFTK